MFAMIEIEYSMEDKHPKNIKILSRLPSDIFQKIWNNNGGVLVQRIMLNMMDDKDLI